MNLNNCQTDDVLVSVIVPVYNVEIYLDECIESVVNQTHKRLEIILVDDGSTDNSGALCDEYSKTDERIKVIHKPNGGLSSARNAGIRKASGEFISFIDSDDWIDNTMIEKLLAACLETNSLLSICGSYVVRSKDNIKVRRCPSQTKCLSLTEFWKTVLSTEQMDFISCDKLYHRSLWDKYEFPEGKRYEDIRVLYKVIEQADLISLVAEPLYYYRIRKGSITSELKSQDLELIEIATEIREYVDNNYPHLQKFSFGFYIMQLCDVMVMIEKQKKEIRNLYKKEKIFIKQVLKKYFWDICFSGNIPIMLKIKTILILTNLLRIANKIREKKK